jgi:chromosome partitioning protein
MGPEAAVVVCFSLFLYLQRNEENVFMARILTVTNQKGGVGKTTSVINIAAGWARKVGPDKVLVVDIDPQASLTTIFLGIAAAAGPREKGYNTIVEVLKQDVDVREAIHMADLPLSEGYVASNVHILPSHAELARVENELNATPLGMFRLADALDAVSSRYEVIVIDCPASLGIYTISALIAAREVIVPVIPGQFEIYALALLQQTIKQVQSPRLNPALRLAAILPIKTDNTNLSRNTIAELQQHFGNLVLPEVRQRVVIGEAHAAGQDIFTYSPGSDSAAMFEEVVHILLERKVLDGR